MRKSFTLILAGILCVMLAASGCTNSTQATPAVTAASPVASLTQATTTPVPEALPWTGTWNTTWLERDGNLTPSVITFTQAGTDVTGNYHYTYTGVGTYNGSINATVDKNILAGTYRETDNDVGFFIFKLSENKNSFTGRWVHAANRSELDNSTLTWNGVRE